jgi:hypothetical protein
VDIAGHFGDFKINNSDLSGVWVVKDILRLQVTMTNFLLVEVLNCLKNGFNYLSDFIFVYALIPVLYKVLS